MSAEGDADANGAGGDAVEGDDRPDHGVPPEYDPYVLRESDADEKGSGRHVFWADRVADEIEAHVADRREATDRASGEERPASREPDEPIVIKGGISPSGIPHLGNANEIVLGYFVAEVLRERGREVRQVFTTDDRDPLRKLPRKLADLDGEIVDLGDVNAGALGKNLGRPYTDIPDPFGCCDSYGEHFSTLIAGIAEQLDVPMDVVSNTDLYERGELDDTVADLLADADRAREVLSEYQDKVDDSYYPFNPICAECGKITETVTDVDVEAGTVSYRCTDMEAGDRTIEGCGHEGEVGFGGGKLPWRFEWVAQWDHLGVDFEPFGKDHAEGSWPSGVDVALNVMDVEPPVPMVYEWFTLDGQPFSSSEGHVVLVSDVLELIEPEALRYFFATDPSKAQDFSIERLDQLVNEFDRLERVYFGEVDADEAEAAFAERVYPFLVEEVDEERIRIPYSFAAVLGMTDDPELREEIARREGHIDEDTPEWAVEEALARVERAREWARRTDNAYNYDLKRDELPDVDFDENVAAALDELAEFVEATDDPDEIQGEIFEIARRHDVDVGDFFAAGYRLLFDQEEGPKLGPFLAKLDEAFVLGRLRRER